jgi:hypothetical protein
MPKISFKNSTTASAVPASLSQGELAVNITDQKLYIGNASSVTTQIIGTVGIQDANTIAISGGTITGVTVGGTTASTVQSSSLTVGGQAITNIDNDTTLAGNSNTAIPTQNAVKTYLDNTLKGRLKNIYTFTSTGTYTKSGSDVNVLHVMVCGAGGGGTSYSIGGGAGGFSETIIAAGGISTVSVTVGTGSAGAAYYSNIGQGGTTSFGGYLSAGGGYGADQNYGHSGGHGGYGYGGIINSTGGGSGSHNNQDQWSHSNAPDPTGGTSYFGGPMAGAHTSRFGSNHGAPGAGGTCVSTGHNGQGGFAGQNGICIVYEYK